MRVEFKSRNANLATGFSNLCLNGATVGYSNVAKQEYDSKGNLRRTIYSTYSNDISYNHVDDVYELQSIDCGNLTCQVIVDGNGNLFKKIENTYFNKPGDECMVAIRYRERWVSFGDHIYEYPDTYNEQQCEAITYKYFNYWHKKTKSIEYSYGAGNTVVNKKTTTYSYNGNKQVDQTTVSDGNGSTRTDVFTYDEDFPELLVRQSMTYNPGVSFTIPSTKTIETEYGLWGMKYLPSKKTLFQVGDNLHSQIEYKYDSHGNLIEEVKDSVGRIVYLYGYNHEYPVARIEGASFAEVQKWATPSLVRAISACRMKSMETYLGILRYRLASYPVLLTTYTYIPLVGISSVTDANGARTTYTYDVDGRLVETKDCNGHVIDRYSYHFKNENE